MNDVIALHSNRTGYGSPRDIVLVSMVGQTVHAGFPSPADDFIEDMIDLNQVLIRNPIATFLWKVEGECMVDVRIFPGDVVIVDRSLMPRHLSIVVAFIDGEPTLKRLHKTRSGFDLRQENTRMPAYALSRGAEVAIWGVVTSTIREFDR